MADPQPRRGANYVAPIALSAGVRAAAVPVEHIAGPWQVARGPRRVSEAAAATDNRVRAVQPKLGAVLTPPGADQTILGLCARRGTQAVNGGRL